MWFNNEAKRQAAEIKATIEAKQTKLQSQQNKLSIALNSIDTMCASDSDSSSDSDSEHDYYHDDSDHSLSF